MEQSTTLAELAKALSKAQGEIKGAIKDSNNPFFKASYADLASVWDACRKPLSENGLAIIQTSLESPDMVIIETTMIHNSGEWVRGKLSMKPVKNDPQGIGSCITYARRYALAAIVGVSPEDDDGNDATGKSKTDSNRKEVEGKKEFKPLPETQSKPKESFSDIMKRECERIGEGKFYELIRQWDCATIEQLGELPRDVQVRAYKTISEIK